MIQTAPQFNLMFYFCNDEKALSAIRGEDYKVLFSEEAYGALHSLLRTDNYSSIIYWIDNHTQIHCLPIFLGNLSELKNLMS